MHSSFFFLILSASFVCSQVSVQQIQGSVSNAYVVEPTGSNQLIVDLLRDKNDSSELLSAINSTANQTYFVTHGHPDHYNGLGGCQEIANTQGNPKFYVGTQAILDSLEDFQNNVAVTFGANISGCDFEVWSGPSTFDFDGLSVTINTDWEPAEAPAAATFEFNDTNGDPNVIIGDIVYGANVHLYFGPGSPSMGITELNNWKNDLETVKVRYDGWILHPGHGAVIEPTQVDTVADANIAYINSWISNLCTAANINDAIDAMKAEYSDYADVFLLDFAAFNPEWSEFINTTRNSSPECGQEDGDSAELLMPFSWWWM